jgi:hypothetical protein
MIEKQLDYKHLRVLAILFMYKVDDILLRETLPNLLRETLPILYELGYIDKDNVVTKQGIQAIKEHTHILIQKFFNSNKFIDYSTEITTCLSLLELGELSTYLVSSDKKISNIAKEVYDRKVKTDGIYNPI